MAVVTRPASAGWAMVQTSSKGQRHARVLLTRTGERGRGVGRAKRSAKPRGRLHSPEPGPRGVQPGSRRGAGGGAQIRLVPPQLVTWPVTLLGRPGPRKAYGVTIDRAYVDRIRAIRNNRPKHRHLSYVRHHHDDACPLLLVIVSFCRTISIELREYTY